MEVSKLNVSYKSYIKVRDASPRLPPLITPHKRQQLISYKEKAVELERQLAFRNELSTLSYNVSASLEHALAFKTDVPCKSDQLTSHVFDVTEYTGNDVIFLNQTIKEDNVEDLSGRNTPRLLRSNSYVLESPSPALLKVLRDNGSLPNSAASEYDLANFENLARKHFGEPAETVKTIDATLPYTFVDEELDRSDTISNFDPLETSSIKTALALSDGNETTTRSIHFNMSASYSIDLEDVNNLELEAEICADPLNVLMTCDDKEARRRWAAITLTATVRGYLVRRLMRTERVRGLMTTIQEAVLCATSLHRENVNAIDQLDVELHRRLVTQIWAACYEFHDIFFKLSTRERMAIIRLDRERQLNKLKRRRQSSLNVESDKEELLTRRSFTNRSNNKYA